MASNMGQDSKYSCIVCEWSEGRRKSPYARSELYDHFKSPHHLTNWQRWLYYSKEQDLGGDYIEDWLQQHQLLALHRSAIASVIR